MKFCSLWFNYQAITLHARNQQSDAFPEDMTAVTSGDNSFIASGRCIRNFAFMRSLDATIAGKWRFFNCFIPFDECARPGVFDLHTIECSGARHIKNNLFTKHCHWKDSSRGKHSCSPWGAIIFLLADWILTKKGGRKMATHSAGKKISGEEREKVSSQLKKPSRTWQREIAWSSMQWTSKGLTRVIQSHISDKTWTNRTSWGYRVILTARRDSVESRWAPFIILTRISFNLTWLNQSHDAANPFLC